MTELLGRDYNAVHDAEMLSKVCDQSQHKEQLKMFTFPVTNTLMEIEAHERLCSNLPSLQILVDEKIISKSMAEKIAKNGIQILHMTLAYEYQGENGIRTLFFEHVSGGKVRIMNHKAVTSKVHNFLAEK